MPPKVLLDDRSSSIGLPSPVALPRPEVMNPIPVATNALLLVVGTIRRLQVNFNKKMIEFATNNQLDLVFR